MNVLGEALKQGLTPAIIVAIYLIIVKIIDSRKESVQTVISNKLINSINTISEYIINLNENIIARDKDKCKIAIEDSMISSCSRLINFVSITVVNNHVETNKENIIANIHNIVNAEFYTVYSTLSLYKINDVKASFYLKKEWISAVEKDMNDIIYNNNLSKEDKIITFSNKINIKFQSYITYITNNVIK